MDRHFKAKSIFEYDNYRQYLKDVYRNSKSEDSKFSFRYFSRIAGFQSPNFLKRVIDGERNLTPASIEKFAGALKLNKEESYFFRHLVLLNQATTADEKKIYAEQLMRSGKFKKIHPLRESEFNYYSHWYFIPIRELAGVKGFREDPEWIANQINPAITKGEVVKALAALQKLGLLRRNEEGVLVLSEPNVNTADEVTSPLIVQFHKEMMKKAGESIDRFSRENREISSATISVTKKGAKRIKELVQNFRQEILEISTQEADPTRVYQLGFQFFPLSNEVEDGEK